MVRWGSGWGRPHGISTYRLGVGVCGDLGAFLQFFG